MPGADGTPLKPGLFGKLVQFRTATIDPAAWREAAEAGEVIGRCRHRGCEGYMVIDDPPTYGQPELRWFMARCSTCTQEVAAPNGRVLRTSSAHREAPDFWAKRKDLLKVK